MREKAAEAETTAGFGGGQMRGGTELPRIDLILTLDTQGSGRSEAR